MARDLYFRVHTSILDEDSKFRQLSLAAIGLWTLLGALAKDQDSTDGSLQNRSGAPMSIRHIARVLSLPEGTVRKLLKELITVRGQDASDAVGLIELVEGGAHATAFRLHKWDRYQNTPAKREAAKERQKKVRESRSVRTGEPKIAEMSHSVTTCHSVSQLSQNVTPESESESEIYPSPTPSQGEGIVGFASRSRERKSNGRLPTDETWEADPDEVTARILEIYHREGADPVYRTKLPDGSILEETMRLLGGFTLYFAKDPPMSIAQPQIRKAAEVAIKKRREAKVHR